MKRLKSFFTFDLPVKYSYIYSHFHSIHERQRYTYASWPTAATRRLLISEYWNNALWHYSHMLVLGSVATLLYDGEFYKVYFFSIGMVGMVAYLPLYFLIYRTIFTVEFLPKLETVIAAYEGRERGWMEKCKQNQPGNRVLALLMFVLDRTSNIGYLSATTKCADLVCKIYGVSQKGIQDELKLILKNSERKKIKMDTRPASEIFNDFEEAYAILKAMNFTKGIQELKMLEQSFINDFSSK